MTTGELLISMRESRDRVVTMRAALEAVQHLGMSPSEVAVFQLAVTAATEAAQVAYDAWGAAHATLHGTRSYKAFVGHRTDATAHRMRKTNVRMV